MAARHIPVRLAVPDTWGARKATLDPSADLRRGDSYRVVVNRGARDEAGNNLDQDQDPSNGNQKKVWRFTVRN